MSNIAAAPAMVTTAEAGPPSITQRLTPDGLNDRLAEAASYAVLRRLVPVLRHDVAGAMQPIRMLLMVLERRVQAPEPDLPAIAKNITSVSNLTKQATADCMNALQWIASSEDARIGLRTAVDEATKLLSLELSAKGLVMVNGVADDATTARQSFLHTVFMGALLAFCDEDIHGGTLHITCQPVPARSHSGMQLKLQLLPDTASKAAVSQDVVRKYRMIGWPDVQAMAQSLGVPMAQGKGWLTLDVPKT